MRIPLLVLLLLPPASAHADDPPYLAAAKERRAKAKAFEVTLTIRTEWKNMKTFGSDERGDLSGTGTAKLAVDGDRFWCGVDSPTRNQVLQTLNRYRVERACDGRQDFTRIDIQLVRGERAGQFDTQYHVRAADPGVGWEGAFLPLRWAFRATERGSLLADEESVSVPITRTFQASGHEEVIGGQRCIEVVQTTTGPYSASKASHWFDAESGYVPKRVDRTVVDYVPHPVCGWRPCGWTSFYTHPNTSETTISTVTVDSFELREAILDERFTMALPVGSRVRRDDESRHETLVVAEDGSLVPEAEKATVPPPQFEPPSVGRTLAVVGGTLAVFAGFVVLLKRLARTRPDDPAGSAVP